MINTITAIFQVFFSICLLRYKPQDLPQSYELLILCLVVYTAINFVLALSAATVPMAMSVSVLETFLVCVITLVILKFGRRIERWVKTLTAISGTGSVIGIIAIPLFFLIFVTGIEGLLQAVVLMFYMMLVVWNVVIMGHILRHSLDTTLGIGIIFAIIYIILTSLVMNYLVPVLENP